MISAVVHRPGQIDRNENLGKTVSATYQVYNGVQSSDKGKTSGEYPQKPHRLPDS